MFVREFGLLQPDRTPCGLPISVSMAHALHDLAETDGLTQTELGARLCLEKSTVSRLLAELLRRGWIVRARDARDGRVARVSLTAEGAGQAVRLQAARAARFQRLAAALSPADQEAVAQSLDTLVRALRDSSDSAEEDHHAEPLITAR